MEQQDTNQRSQAQGREWPQVVAAAVAIVAAVALITAVGLAAVEATEVVGDRIEQVLFLLDHAEQEARQERGER